MAARRGAYIGKVRTEYRRARYNNNIIARLYFAKDRIECAPHPPFYPVAAYAVAQFFAYGKANVFKRGRSVLCEYNDHQLVRLGISSAVYIAEFLIPLQ